VCRVYADQYEPSLNTCLLAKAAPPPSPASHMDATTVSDPKFTFPEIFTDACSLVSESMVAKGQGGGACELSVVRGCGDGCNVASSVRPLP